MLDFRAVIRYFALPIVALIAVVFAVTAGGVPAAAQTTAPNDLFVSVGNATPDANTASVLSVREGVLQTRYIGVNVALLSSRAIPGQDMVRLPLFNNRVVTAVNDRIEFSPALKGVYSWVGHIQGIAYSEVILTVNGSLVAGRINTLDALYEVNYAGNNVHALLQLDPSTGARHHHDPLVAPAANVNTPALTSPASDGGSIIDVMIVYTAAARAQAGSTAAIQAEIATVITSTNQAYINSGANQRVRLVYTMEINYTESGDMETDLYAVTDGTGVFGSIDAIRTQHGADLVDLVVTSDNHGYAGIAWIMQNLSVGFAPHGYSVVLQKYLTTYGILSHEMGHNMGNAHDYADSCGIHQSGCSGVFPYSFGYNDPNNKFHTIMAYYTGCSASCPGVNYFSNETRLYQGVVMGNANADNTKSMNNTASTVAKFRQSVMSPGVDTIGIYRAGTFLLHTSNNGGPADIAITFGGAAMYPVAGDWTGQGIDTIGVYDRSTGNFYLRNSNTNGTPNETLRLGNPNDLPLAGRWTAAATHSGVGVFRPTNGLIYMRNTLTTGFADYVMVLGSPGDVGIAGDWTGKGYDSPGVFRPTNAIFYLSDKTSGTVFADHTVALGTGTDLPLAGDWVGAGSDGVGVFRPSTGTFYLKNTLLPTGIDNSFVFGQAGDRPVAGHWISPATTPAPIIQPNNNLIVPGANPIVPTQNAPSSFDG